MSLRSRTIVVIGATLLALIVVLYTLSRAVLLGGFGQIEEANVGENVGRVTAALSDVLAGLDSTAGDWAAWDATYAFAREGNAGFIAENLAPVALQTIRVGVVLFVKPMGEVLFARAIDLESGEEMAVPAGLATRLPSDDRLLAHLDLQGSTTGVIQLEEGPLLVASRPILTSSREGPSPGTLIMGRYLDSSGIGQLGERLGLSLAVEPIAMARLPADFLAAHPVGQSEHAPRVGVINRDAIAGYALVRDLYGQPAFVVRIEMPRAIYHEAQSTIGYILILLVAAGLVFGTAMLLFLERSVLARLVGLARTVGSIDALGSLRRRIAVRGNDELSRLALEIDSMLSRVRESEQSARRSEELYRVLFEGSRDAVYLTTEAGQFVDLNQAAVELFGYAREEIMLLNARDLYTDPGDRERFREVADKAGAVRDYPVKLERKDGCAIDCLLTSTVRRDPGGNVLGYQGIVRDVTAQKRAAERLMHLATHDVLTDLPNRAAFTDRLSLEIEHARRERQGLAVMLVDLDRFKQVNDTLGHAAGDQVLRAVSDRLRAALRRSDTIARLGGDEFLLLVPEVGAATDASEVARKVLEALRKFFVIDQHEVRVDASIGIAMFPEAGSDVGILMKNADEAMYSAKEHGRGRYQFYGVPAGD